MKAPLTDRLAALQIEVSPDAATMHLARIDEELRQPLPAPPPRLPLRFRLAAALAAIAVPLLSAGVAIAAENTVPGDALYPVKEVTEWARSLVDPTVTADHRVDELEIFIDRRVDYAVITHHLDRAETAVRDHPFDLRLHDRLDAARHRIERDYPVTDRMVTDHAPSDVPPIDRPRDELDPADQLRPSDERPLDDRHQDGASDIPEAESTPMDEHDPPAEGSTSDGANEPTSDRPSPGDR